jgi:hypothetical protein
MSDPQKNPLKEFFGLARQEICGFVSKNQAAKFALGSLKLANEWRDTLGYSAAASWAGHLLATGNFDGATEFMLFSTLVREGIRTFSWLNSDELKTTDSALVRLDPSKLAAAASSVNTLSTALLVGSYSVKAASTSSPEFAPFLLGSATFVVAHYCQVQLAGGYREILKAYTETMWDYPRKKDKGGPPNQTDKLVKWVSEVAARAGGIGELAPQPAFAPSMTKLISQGPQQG